MVVSSGAALWPRSRPTKRRINRESYKRVLGRRIGQVEPLLEKVDTKHHLELARRAPVARQPGRPAR